MKLTCAVVTYSSSEPKVEEKIIELESIYGNLTKLGDATTDALIIIEKLDFNMDRVSNVTAGVTEGIRTIGFSYGFLNQIKIIINPDVKRKKKRKPPIESYVVVVKDSNGFNVLSQSFSSESETKDNVETRILDNHRVYNQKTQLSHLGIKWADRGSHIAIVDSDFNIHYSIWKTSCSVPAE